MSNIDKVTIGQIKELSSYLSGNDYKGKEPVSIEHTKKKHGLCLIVLSVGFMYIGELITDGEFLTIDKPIHVPKLLQTYMAGKGLLWYARNGNNDLRFEQCSDQVLAPHASLKQFIPTKANLWYKE